MESSMYLIWRVDAFPNLPEYAPLPIISGSGSHFQKFFSQVSLVKLVAGFVIWRQSLAFQCSLMAEAIHASRVLQTLGEGVFSR
jgi:hypothetical protein